MDQFDLLNLQILCSSGSLTTDQVCDVIEAYIHLHKGVKIKCRPQASELVKFEQAATIACNFFQFLDIQEFIKTKQQ